MNELEDFARESFAKSVENLILQSDQLSNELAHAGLLLANQLIEGKKIFTCGIGSTLGDAQYFNDRLNCFLHLERPPLPAYCLSSDFSQINSIADHLGQQKVISYQLNNLAESGDVIVMFAFANNNLALIDALECAREKNIFPIVICKAQDTEWLSALSPNELSLNLTSKNPARQKETAVLITHTLIEIIEKQLFGS